MEKMMNAAVLHAVGDLRYEKVPMPTVHEGEVLMKVMAAGVCGSDIPRVFEKGTYHFPTIPGHEFAGLIVDGDPELVGKRAAVFPLLPCRKCASCEVGEYANCKNYDYYGSRRDGGFAEYIAVDKRNLVITPDDLSYACASLCEPAPSVAPRYAASASSSVISASYGARDPSVLSPHSGRAAPEPPAYASSI